MSKSFFTCPKCGSHFFNTSLSSDWQRAQGHCKGHALYVVGEGGKLILTRDYTGCDFTWKRSEDDKICNK